MPRILYARPWIALAPFLGLFVLVPLVAPYNDNLYDDEGAYVGLAKTIASGHLLTGRDTAVGGGNAPPDLWFGPGLPALLAPLERLHAPLMLVRMVGPISFFLALLVFYALLRQFVSDRRALAGACAFGLYVPLYTTIAFVHTEPLAALLLTLSVYGAVRYAREGSVWLLAVAAVSFALLALVRVDYGWVLSALVVVAAGTYAIRRGSEARRLLLVVSLAFVLCLPWLVYTHSVSGELFYWGSSGGLSLYWISSPYPQDRGDWHGAHDVFTDPNLAAQRPFFRSLIGLDLAAQNRAFERRAFRNIRRHPFKFLRNVADNISRMTFNVPYSFHGPRATSVVYALPNALVLIGLLAAAWRVRQRPDAVVLFIAAFAAIAFGMHALLAAYPRMLMPFMPILFLAIVASIPERAAARA